MHMALATKFEQQASTAIVYVCILWGSPVNFWLIHNYLLTSSPAKQNGEANTSRIVALWVHCGCNICCTNALREPVSSHQAYARKLTKIGCCSLFGSSLGSSYADACRCNEQVPEHRTAPVVKVHHITKRHRPFTVICYGVIPLHVHVKLDCYQSQADQVWSDTLGSSFTRKQAN